MFHALPAAGGVLDQPAGLVKKMRLYLNYYHALDLWKRHKAGNEAQFIKQYPEAWAVVKEVSNG